MKRVIKIVLICLIAIIVAVLMLRNAFAEGSYLATVSSSASSIEAGDSVVVTLNLNKPTTSLQAKIEYDSNVYDFVEATGCHFNDQGNVVAILFLDSQATDQMQTVSTINVTFRAKSSIETETSTSFTVQSDSFEATDEEGTQYSGTTALRNGAITTVSVSPKAVTPDPVTPDPVDPVTPDPVTPDPEPSSDSDSDSPVVDPTTDSEEQVNPSENGNEEQSTQYEDIQVVDTNSNNSSTTTNGTSRTSSKTETSTVTSTKTESSSSEEAVPKTGESKAETIALFAIICLSVMTFVFFRKSK